MTSMMAQEASGLNVASIMVRTPIGPLHLTSVEHFLCRVRYAANIRVPQKRGRKTVVLRAAKKQLGEYFRGERHSFSLALDFSAGTEFQQEVCRAAIEIPYGQTVSYGELAASIGRPRAARAVGGALGWNPLLIVVPCHRVVRSDGSLGGFGAGLEVKRALLELEGYQP